MNLLPDLPTLALFLVATVTLNVTPGPDMLYVIANSIGLGRKAGVVSALGIGGGTLVHTFAGALGLSALLMSSATAFDLVRYAGAVYLLYLGIRSFMSKEAQIVAGRVPQIPLGTVFKRGVATNVLNPKVALFFLAFLPQFVDPSRGAVILQFLLLGTMFNLSGTLVNTIVALLVGFAGDRFADNPGFAWLQRWFTGSVFVALGARLALAGDIGLDSSE